MARWVGRAIGLDVHRDFCEIAICEEDGQVRSAGRVKTTPEALKVMAESLLSSDRVVLEVTANAWEIARILEPQRPGSATGCGLPISGRRRMRRRLARREQLVRARSRANNEIYAVLLRCLKGKPPMSDLFGVGGRQSLRALEGPVEEAETVEACMRQIEFLDAEVAEVERQIAREALRCPDVRRLMTVPALNVICAAEFIAAIGDIRRFRSSRQLAAYLGLDPKVRQSGDQPARSGRISKQGSPSARWALVEAAGGASFTSPALCAYYERLRARRGHGKAILATARKLAVLCWCLLTREENYAHQQPSLTANKLRRARADRRRPRSTAARPPGSGPPTRRSGTPKASSPSRPKRPTRGWSATGKPADRQRRRWARA